MILLNKRVINFLDRFFIIASYHYCLWLGNKQKNLFTKFRYIFIRITITIIPAGTKPAPATTPKPVTVKPGTTKKPTLPPNTVSPAVTVPPTKAPPPAGRFKYDITYGMLCEYMQLKVFSHRQNRNRFIQIY